jgi:hypothetical protein
VSYFTHNVSGQDPSYLTFVKNLVIANSRDPCSFEKIC